ncbi:hypothetical protein DES42_108153 [Zavarzinia compransoris]|nr:hypothetical protein DES42_108153 [Zavarzinia compransoris]
MVRLLSRQFMDALKSGTLAPLLDVVQRDRGLTLEIRSDKADIYCKGQVAAHIEPGKGGYIMSADKAFWGPRGGGVGAEHRSRRHPLPCLPQGRSHAGGRSLYGRGHGRIGRIRPPATTRVAKPQGGRHQRLRPSVSEHGPRSLRYPHGREWYRCRASGCGSRPPDDHDPGVADRRLHAQRRCPWPVGRLVMVALARLSRPSEPLGDGHRTRSCHRTSP